MLTGEEEYPLENEQQPEEERLGEVELRNFMEQEEQPEKIENKENKAKEKPLLHNPTKHFKIKNINKQDFLDGSQKIPLRKKIKKHRQDSNRYLLDLTDEKRMTLNQIRRSFPENSTINVNYTSNYYNVKSSPSSSYITITEHQEAQIDELMKKNALQQHKYEEKLDECLELQEEIERHVLEMQENNLAFEGRLEDQASRLQAEFEDSQKRLREDFQSEIRKMDAKMTVMQSSNQILQEEVKGIMENQQLEKLMQKLRQIVSQIQVQKYNQSQLAKEYASSADYLQLVELVCPLLIHNTSINDKSSAGKRLPSTANGFSNSTAITVNNNYNYSEPLGFMAGNKIQQ